MTAVVFLFSVPVVWLLINYFIIFARHKKAIKQIAFLQERTKDEQNLLAHVKMRYTWGGRHKRYFSWIVGCDIYLLDNYVAIAPFQTFPFKGYHAPILFTDDVNGLKRKLSFLSIFKPDKVVVSSIVQGEVNIEYRDEYGSIGKVKLNGVTNEFCTRITEVLC